MTIKVFRSDQLGAPNISGMNAPTLIGALDALCVVGYGDVTATQASMVGDLVTVTFSTPHGLLTGDSAVISGAVESYYNGEFVVTALSSTVFTYHIPVVPSNVVTPTNGTIVSKRAPAGFTKLFSGEGKAVYQANDVNGRRFPIRVVDNGTSGGGYQEARVTCYESMTDVNTGDNMFPTNAMLEDGFVWYKSDTADDVAKAWVAISDGKTFYWWSYIDTPAHTGYLAAPSAKMYSVAFGDINSYKPGDFYASFLTGAPAENTFLDDNKSGLYTPVTAITNKELTSAIAPLVMARTFTAIATPRLAGLFASGLNDTTLGSDIYMSYPHAPDNGFYMTPILVTQDDPALIRGRMPGLFEPMHGPCFPNTTIVDNVQGYPGRKFMMMHGKNGTAVGSLMVDITGPWDA